MTCQIEGAGIALFNPEKTHVLLIKDSRNHKWSLPKGGVESFDNSYLDTAIREMTEETGFIWGIDYILDRNDGQFTHYMIYSGTSFTNNLRFSQCLKEYVAEIKWIPIQDIHKLHRNFVTLCWERKNINPYLKKI